MKKILTLTLLLSIFCLPAQRFTITKKKCLENLKKETLVVPTGYGQAFDEAMKAAVEKYWTFSKIKYMKKDQASGDCNIYIQEGSEEHGISNNYHTCDFMGFDAPGVGMSGFQMFFDNDHLYKHPEEVNGIDKNYDDMSYKITQFVMALCAEVKRVEEEGVAKYTMHGGNEKDKIKDYKILIPQEYLDLGMAKEAFTAKLGNSEFMKVQEIHKKLVSQNTLEGTAELLLSKAYGILRLYIIDLKTGKLIYYESIGGGVSKSGPTETKNVEKILKGL